MRVAMRMLGTWAVAGLIVAGCSSSSGDDTASSAHDGGGDASSGAAAGGEGAPADAVPPAAGPRIVKKADVQLEIGRDALGGAVDRATTIAERHGGYVATTDVSHGDAGSSGTLVVRVPAAAFDAARRELSALGEVTDERLSGDDVTAQLVDHEARIRSLQAQEDALRTLLGRANAVGEVLQVQGQLFEVRRQIEQLQAQHAALADAADYSTITMRLVEPGGPAARNRPDDPATGIARSLERAWDAAVAVVGGMIVALGVALPLGAVAGLAWLAWRAVARRRSATPEPAA